MTRMLRDRRFIETEFREKAWLDGCLCDWPAVIFIPHPAVVHIVGCPLLEAS